MKKLVKLALAAVALAGSLAVGVPARPANAVLICPDMCCDSKCRSFRNCYPDVDRCVCEVTCQGV